MSSELGVQVAGEKQKPRLLVGDRGSCICWLAAVQFLFRRNTWPLLALARACWTAGITVVAVAGIVRVPVADSRVAALSWVLWMSLLLRVPETSAQDGGGGLVSGSPRVPLAERWRGASTAVGVASEA